MSINLSNTERLYQKIGLNLIEKIAAGDYKIGERLPPEREFAEQMNVSRSVIRESLIMLELQGLVKVRKGSGVYVINTPDALPAESTQISFNKEFENSNDAGPFEMLQARQLLESHVAEFAATQVTKTDIKRLRLALELERKDLENSCSSYEGDEMFHMTIAETTKNSVLVDMVKDLWKSRKDSFMWKQLHSRIGNQDYRQRWLSDHELILSALQKKDAAAAKDAMWRHLENVKQILFELSDTDDPKFDGFLFNSYHVLDKSKV